MHGREGETKGILLDWELLLPPGDNEPPRRLVIVPEAGRSERQADEGMMLEDDDESHLDQVIQSMTDKQLEEKIDRIKTNQRGLESKLPDAGKKLQKCVRRHEAELNRRNLRKADDKCKKAAASADSSTCIGSTDASVSRGVSRVPESQSEFASRFCRKLDENKTPKSVFADEISTLNHCGQKRRNEQIMSIRTQKRNLSSRQAPFKSPNYLSAQTNDPPQTNHEHLRSQSSSPSPRQPDRDLYDYSEKKENAHRLQPMRNAKGNNKHVFLDLVDEEEPAVDAVNQTNRTGESSKETTIYYLSRDDPQAVEIRHSDMECLAPESYLSSTIMNFYIRYLQKPISQSTRKRCDYHFFNTYFYKKLKRDVLSKSNKEILFEKFRRWWKGVNIFEKAYIFLPIHESLHWSLIIICIPDKEDKSGPIILHLDSLGMHFSESIFNDVKSFLIEEWKFLREEEVLPALPIPDNIWDKLSRRIEDKVIEVPQQRNEYDCGLFVLFFMERFLEEAPERLKKKDLDMFGKQWFRPEEASNLRRKIRDILKQEFENANGATCDDAVNKFSDRIDCNIDSPLTTKPTELF